MLFFHTKVVFIIKYIILISDIANIKNGHNGLLNFNSESRRKSNINSIPFSTKTMDLVEKKTKQMFQLKLTEKNKLGEEDQEADIDLPGMFPGH